MTISAPGADLQQQEDRSLAGFVYVLRKARKQFAFIVCIAGVVDGLQLLGWKT